MKKNKFVYEWVIQGNYGHGRNGAPYEMGDVYQDMKDCESMVYELWEALDNEE